MAKRIANLEDRAFDLTEYWKKFLLLFYFYRCFASAVADLVIVRITSIGDTASYQQGRGAEGFGQLGLTEVVMKAVNYGDFQLATHLTGLVGRLFNIIVLGNTVLINVAFQSIAFVGIVYLLMSVPATQRLRLAILLALPSFTLWTSMASKECIIVFSVCVLGGAIVRMYYDRFRFDLLVMIAFCTIWVFKPHYVPALFYIFAVTFLGRYVKQKALLALIVGMFSLAVLFVFRDYIDFLSFGVQRGFTTFLEGSTRKELFFVEPYDVFTRAPLGFLMALVGPTLEETLTSPLHLFSFVESMLLLAILFFYVSTRLPTLPIYSVISGCFLVFWTIFPNYPFGVMNPGSATRYRSGWIVLLFIAVAILQSRELYATWLRRSRRVAT